ncbi:MFS transporter [Streptomyces sp. NPDC050658]|uniref:MFS transporter n=1 Tax=unclassified Streptomyces TaxID=2593676 RepID=UPI00341F4C83
MTHLENGPRAGTARPAGPPATRTTPAFAVVVSIALVELTSGVMQGFLAPLLKQLTDTLHVSVADLNWISIANLLASVAFTPVLSRMGDLYGHRKVLRWNLAIVLVGSILVGLSRSFEMLLVGQIFQGAFAGFFPLLVGILRNRGGNSESRRGISLMVAALLGGLALGLVASGAVAAYATSLTAALWVPTAVVAIALAVTWPLLPESDTRQSGSVDWLGGLLLCVGLVAVMLGLGLGGTPGWEWTSPRTVACLAGGVLVTAVWVLVELRTDSPMIDVRLFVRRNVIVVSLVTLTFPFCMIGLQVANPVFLGTGSAEAGYGLGLAPLGVALAMLPNMLMTGVGALIAPSLASVLSDRRTLVTGSLLMAAGYVSAVVAHDELMLFLAGTAVAGAGAGLMQYATRTLAVEAVPREQTSVGSGINELLINVGGSLGAAAVLSISAARTPAGASLPRLDAYTTSWWVCAAVSLAGAAIAFFYRREDNPARH